MDAIIAMRAMVLSCVELQKGDVVWSRREQSSYRPIRPTQRLRCLTSAAPFTNSWRSVMNARWRSNPTGNFVPTVAPAWPRVVLAVATPCHQPAPQPVFTVVWRFHRFTKRKAKKISPQRRWFTKKLSEKSALIAGNLFLDSFLVYGRLLSLL